MPTPVGIEAADENSWWGFFRWIPGARDIYPAPEICTQIKNGITHSSLDSVYSNPWPFQTYFQNREFLGYLQTQGKTTGQHIRTYLRGASGTQASKVSFDRMQIDGFGSISIGSSFLQDPFYAEEVESTKSRQRARVDAANSSGMELVIVQNGGAAQKKISCRAIHKQNRKLRVLRCNRAINHMRRISGA